MKSATIKKGARVVPSYPNGFVSDKVRRRLEHLVSGHVDSFSYFLEHGISEAVSDMPPLEMKLDNEGSPIYIKINVTNIHVGYPTRPNDDMESKFTPREARERGLSYTGAMSINYNIIVTDNMNSDPINFTSSLGNLPIMVQSERCNLKGCTPQQLLAFGEEENEMGGYFIMNGIERVIRLLQVPRRNHAMAIQRNSYKNRGPSYSDKGVAMRCTRPDQSSITVTMHYLNSGGATIRLVVRKQEFLLPVVLVAKALVEISDKEIFDRVMQGDTTNTFASTRMEMLLRDAKSFAREHQESLGHSSSSPSISSNIGSLKYLGSLFRIFLPITDRTSDLEAGKIIVQRYLFVHVESAAAKFECLIHMIRKLFSFAQGRCDADNADALMNHELLLPGHLINMSLKEKVEDCLVLIKGNILKDFRMNKDKCLRDIHNVSYFQKMADRFGGNIGGKIGTFLSTGNLISSTGLDLMQVSGFTVVAERLNIFRYMSHFQSVHRGQFFTTMKTTAVRKLLPESWGYLCPVHTPDGSPCGLLNHMARDCVILSYPPSIRYPTTPEGPLTPPLSSTGDGFIIPPSHKAFKALLVSFGVVPVNGAGGGDGRMFLGPEHMCVMLDGDIVGGIHFRHAKELVSQLRLLKVQPMALPDGGELCIDPTTEVAYFPFPAPDSPGGGCFPGVYLATQPGRLVRQVLQMATKKTEWIGPMEQVFLEIACLPGDIRSDTTHAELAPDVMLSQIAALTPFSDCNQSPRNMYQCQMGKQTMGTPAHALKHRSDNKLYRIQTPEIPLVQNKAQGEYMMDLYPQGTNAVVAVISYTGYDMEDAMIINKAAYERGFMHGSMYKTFVIDLEDEEKRASRDGDKVSLYFGNAKPALPGSPSDHTKIIDTLDFDGLPFEGDMVAYGEPLCCLINPLTGDHKIIKHKETESAHVDTVRVIGSGSGYKGSGSKSSLRRVSITLRFKRNPVIGDKFSSRHGQKGTLGVLWPQQDMPFTESGMTPDIMINPHAFPSRMTIGMLIESMAGKSGAIHGIFQDSTPFRFHEDQKVIDFFGEQLRSAGYHYYGSEPMYSGASGLLMKADIFIGVVFYQRLRHMVSDKSQARSTGAVMAVTRQPVKGRKRHGGIRLGEMERDALLSHGVSFCVHDRLLNCSDLHTAFVCSTCGDLINVYAKSQRHDIVASANGSAPRRGQSKQYCHTCHSEKGVRSVQMPYVFRYLTNELAGMGIRMTLKVSE